MEKTDSEQTGDTPVGEARKGCMTRRLTPWWVDWVIIPLVLLVLWALTDVSISRTKDKPKEAQVKANLHAIQVALERYAVDHNGEYPTYLIGGEAKFSKVIYKPGLEDDKYPPQSRWSLINARPIGRKEGAADILIREGYLTSYPKNPFATNGAAIHRLQEDYGDPLRNGTEEAKLHGTRFGPYCTLMGNVLADFRYTEFSAIDEEGNERAYPTHADFGYPFYDIYKKGSNFPKPFLPGEFFYRSRSVPAFINGEYGQQLITDAVQDYMLGGYGSIRTKGRDIFGPDPTGVNIVSPFGVEGAKGNPNGIRDSIILVLVPGPVVPGG